MSARPRRKHRQFLGLRAVKPKLIVRDLSPALWPALEELFGPRGACGGCWCMHWRLEKGERWDDLKGLPAKRRMKALVAAGKAQGAIAFAGKEPVGWIAFGPRRDFPRLDRARTLACEDADAVWSLPCFFIKAGWRDQGVAGALLAHALKVAAPAGREDRGGLSGEPEAGAAAAECLRLDGHALALSRMRGSSSRVRRRLRKCGCGASPDGPPAVQPGSSSSTASVGSSKDGASSGCAAARRSSPGRSVRSRLSGVMEM